MAMLSAALRQTVAEKCLKLRLVIDTLAAIAPQDAPLLTELCRKRYIQVKTSHLWFSVKTVESEPQLLFEGFWCQNSVSLSKKEAFGV